MEFKLLAESHIINISAKDVIKIIEQHIVKQAEIISGINPVCHAIMKRKPTGPTLKAR